MKIKRINMSVDLMKNKRQLNEIENAVEILKNGGQIIYPTETFYGIGADALNPEAVKVIFELKGRTESKPLPLIISDREMLDLLGVEINEISIRLIESFWPGPLTILFKIKRKLPEGIVSSDKKVAVRISSNPIAVKIVQLFGMPITATSANLSGSKNPEEIFDIPHKLLNSVGTVIDAGKLNGLGGSTIVDPTNFPIKIIREGAISSTKVLSVV